MTIGRSCNGGGRSGRAIFFSFLLAVAVGAIIRMMIGYVKFRHACHISNIIIRINMTTVPVVEQVRVQVNVKC